MRSSHVKRLNFTKGLSSCKEIVATDVALANLEKIDKNELVSRWILADASSTAQNLKQDETSLADLCSSPTFDFDKDLINREDESSVSFVQKSPLIKCKLTEFIQKSPIIGGNKKIKTLHIKSESFGSVDKRKLDRSGGSSSTSVKSPILGKTGDSSLAGKYRREIKRRRLERCLSFDKDNNFVFDKNHTRSSESRLNELKLNNEIKTEPIESSPELFGNEEDGECITESPNPIWKVPAMIKEEKTDFLFLNEEPYENYKIRNMREESIVGSPTMKSVSKIEESFIQDTEEFSLPKSKTKNDANLTLELELGIEERPFVPDTECIDYDTNSETEDDKICVKEEIVIGGIETDSDKTVSDIIEEPTTQEYIEPLISDMVLDLKLKKVSSLSKCSPRISETVSQSPNISVVDISVEITPPRLEGEDCTSLLATNLDSGKKKKKSKPKKGSLGARLQKLISGQASCVRLWRHQMSRESTIERPSAPCTTLLVINKWNEYGKDLYLSKVVDDPYNLLKDYSAGDGGSRNLVVMTNPDFVGSVKMPPGTIFAIYLPWEIFKPDLESRNFVLHALYFNTVTNSCDIKSEKNDDEVLGVEIVRKFDCPCLKNGKVDDYCLSKFTDDKIDVIKEIVKL